MLQTVPHKCRLGAEFIKPVVPTTNRKTPLDAMKNPKCLRAKLSVLIIWQRLVLASGAPESFSTNLMQKHQLFNPGTLESRDRLPTFFFIPFFLLIQNWNVGRLARWPSRICIHMQIHSCSVPPVIYSTCTVITRLVRCVRACLGLGRQLSVYRWIERMQITGVGLTDVQA